MRIYKIVPNNGESHMDGSMASVIRFSDGNKIMEKFKKTVVSNKGAIMFKGISKGDKYMVDMYLVARDGRKMHKKVELDSDYVKELLYGKDKVKDDLFQLDFFNNL